MNLSRNILILTIFTLIISAPFVSLTRADEGSDVKKELQELRL